MRIVLFCATRRGAAVLEKLRRLCPDARLTALSFPETPWEPPFLRDIQRCAASVDADFHETRDPAGALQDDFWDRPPVDIALCVNWRYRIPPEVYTRPRLGTFVFHDSLLPRYRGFSPTVWAVVNGERETGVSLFEMTDEIDAGDLIDQQAVPIAPDETITSVTKNVTDTYLELLERNLAGLIEGAAPRVPQDPSRATYTCRFTPDDARIRWSASTDTVFNLIRGYTRPYPGAFTTLDGQVLRIWAAKRDPACPVYAGRVPGRVAEIRNEEGVRVLTGDGAVLVTEVQRETGPVQRAGDVLRTLSHTLGR